jgi:hypothetical protein
MAAISSRYESSAKGEAALRYSVAIVRLWRAGKGAASTAPVKISEGSVEASQIATDYLCPGWIEQPALRNSSVTYLGPRFIFSWIDPTSLWSRFRS